MLRTISVDGKEYECTTDARDFFREDEVKQFNANMALEMMLDCLDTVYELVSKHYPAVIKPELFLTNEPVVNAYAIPRGIIVVTTKLIFDVAELIEKRYSKEVMEKYRVLVDLSHKEMLSLVRVYLWRFILLHELYHLWNGHSNWKKKYKFDDDGILVERISEESVSLYESENAEELKKNKTFAKSQDRMTQQALELDADASAVCMLINLLMLDARARQVVDLEAYVKNHIACMMAALATAFCMFDGNSGARFEALGSLNESTHPLSSIRLVYAEEIADGMLHRYFPEKQDLWGMEFEWQKMICDVEAEYDGKVDMGQVFYFTAYTEKAQRHLCALKHRLYDIHDTLSTFVLGNNADKLCEDEMCYLPEYVWFTDEGKSLRGWINPATGKGTAIKAKPKPVVKETKIGRNEPCPCGSGVKFKKCTCSKYHTVVM